MSGEDGLRNAPAQSTEGRSDMSAVIAVLDLMEAAASDLAKIGDALNAAHLTESAPTIAVLPAAADEVSASIAHLFSGYGQEYQKLAGEAAAFHEQFVQHLTASAGAYASAEAANTALLQPLTDPLVNSVNAAVGQFGNLINTNIFVPLIQNVLIPTITFLASVIANPLIIPAFIIFFPAIIVIFVLPFVFAAYLPR